ncbi:MAG: flagellar export chaperone FliS [Legionellaceae bacterium]|nr:flagellar export chaperone FliS [Legionellaceae bacterium]
MSINYHKQYQNLELSTRIEEASPHELINLLLQGARTNIATAKGCIQRGNTKGKGEHIGKAIDIIDGLKSCLDYDNGGDIASNLGQLYDYIQQVLLRANLDSSESLLTEANTLLTEVHEAWQSITESSAHQ